MRPTASRLAAVSLLLLIQLLSLDSVYAWKLRSIRSKKPGATTTTTKMPPLDNYKPSLLTTWMELWWPVPQPEYPPSKTTASSNNNIILAYTGIVTVTRSIYNFAKTIIWYKPPVGIAALYFGLRILWFGKAQQGNDGANQQTRYRTVVPMDPDDLSYQDYGSIEPIRHRLVRAVWQDCTAASLVDASQTSDSSNSNNDNNTIVMNDPAYTMANAIVQALDVPHMQENSPWHLVRGLVKPIATVESLLASTSPRDLVLQSVVNPSKDKQQRQQKVELSTSSLVSDLYHKTTITMSTAEYHQMLGATILSLQVHALDALLRLARNRLLQSCRRLQRTRNYWKRHSTSRIYAIILSPRRRILQRRLSEATAAYQVEIERLGRVSQLLYKRPVDLQHNQLLNALKKQQQQSRNDDTTTYLLSPSVYKKFPLVQKAEGFLFHSWYGTLKQVQWPSWWATHKFNWSRKRIKLLDADLDVDPQLAKKVLLDTTTKNDWALQARDWTFEVRNTLCDIVDDTLQGCVQTDKYNTTDFRNVKYQWCVQKYDKSNTDNIDTMWLRMLSYVDAMPTWTRLGHGSKLVRVRDFMLLLIASESWWQTIDYHGIPSAVLGVSVANVIHNKAAPHWPRFKRESQLIFQTLRDICRERIWVPLEGIYADIMNKNPGLTSAFGIGIEQTSLDHMLRDLGCGDGTAATRELAIKKATEMYEEQLRSGLVWNAVRGRLPRLLLIQVQQLKVGMLSALETIDVLLKGNRIHFQILAAVPAVLILTYGTRLFFRSLYNIRSRDLRPLTSVHNEMTQLLFEVQHLLLKASPASTLTEWDPSLLGELLLTMQRYLILLDYVSPPLANRPVERLTESLQEMLGRQGLLKSSSADYQWKTLQVIQARHRELIASS